MGAANLVSSAAAKRYHAVPVAFAGERILVVAMADPSNVLAVDDISIMTGYEVRPVVSTREDILNLIGRLDRLDDVVTDAEEEAAPRSSTCTIRRRCPRHQARQPDRRPGGRAARLGHPPAPDDRDLRVRFRIDGVLHDAPPCPGAWPPASSRA